MRIIINLIGTMGTLGILLTMLYMDIAQPTITTNCPGYKMLAECRK
jgi:hypothetical protein